MGRSTRAATRPGQRGPARSAPKRRSPPIRNIPIGRLLVDRDERFRPRPLLAESVERDIGGLDRPIVPLLNALYDIGMPTGGSCAGHRRDRSSLIGAHVVFEGAGERVEAATKMLASLFPGHRRTDVRYKADLSVSRSPGPVTFVELATQAELDHDLAVHERYLKVADDVRRRGRELPLVDRPTLAAALLAGVYAELAVRELRDRPGEVVKDKARVADLDLWLHHHDPPEPCVELSAGQASWCFLATEQRSGTASWFWTVQAGTLRAMGARLRAGLKSTPSRT